MLQSLHVKNLALIDEIEVEFGQGLNILTGETGAGKSIILGSVNLALGGRYTKDILRAGAEYGFVELVFLLKNPEQIQKLRALDIYPEEGMVVLSRRFTEGRSVSRINGETVQMTQLKEAAQVLIDIHGQHEHQSLLYKKRHIEIVDEFSAEYIRQVKEQTAAAWKRYKTCFKELSEADMDESQRAKELSFLQFEAEEIEKAALKPGEDEDLETQYRRMSNGRKIAESVEEAYAYTSDGEASASEALSRAIRALSEAVSYDRRAEELYHQLGEVDGLLNDLNRELSEYRKTCDFSEEEFYETGTRLDEINHLKQKYGTTIAAIQQYYEEQEEKIQKLQDYDRYIAVLQGDCEKAEKELKEQSALLSKLRKEQAIILEEQIQEGLQELNFADVRFEIQFTELPECAENGMDDVEFLISLNPGQPVRPLAHVASGGELSRIMLAIKTVMADRDDIETLIFDEIDAGISGRTAQKVSEKMAVLGKKHQVICITHLAQIAAQADRHYVIEKTTSAKTTKTDIRLLGREEEVQELARILGGAKITDAVLRNADEMKQLAKQTK